MKVPLDPTYRQLLVAQVTIHGVHEGLWGRATAAIDTGATHVMILPDAARSLGYSLEGAPRVRIVTGAGVVYAPRIVLARMEIGRVSADGVEAVCHDLPEECAVDALVGLSFLTRFRVSFDFDAWEMELVPRG